MRKATPQAFPVVSRVGSSGAWQGMVGMRAQFLKSDHLAREALFWDRCHHSFHPFHWWGEERDHESNESLPPCWDSKSACHGHPQGGRKQRKLSACWDTFCLQPNDMSFCPPLGHVSQVSRKASFGRRAKSWTLWVDMTPSQSRCGIGTCLTGPRRLSPVSKL